MKTFKKACFLLFGVPLVFLLVVNILPHLYTPPALPQNKRAVYDRVVAFVENRRELGNIELTSSGKIYIQRRPLWLDDRQYLPGFLSDEDIALLLELWQAMQKVGCAQIETEGDMMIFQPAFSYLLPHPPRVLYSLKGNNPNNTGGRLVRPLRPYYQLEGNWYATSKYPGPWRGGY